MSKKFRYLGTAIAYPLVITEEGNMALQDGPENVRESITEILATPIGQRMMLPEYGSRLEEFIFEQNDEVLYSLLEGEIFDALERWEPRIEVQEVSFDVPREAPQRVDITINYRILRANEVDVAVYPFYRELEN